MKNYNFKKLDKRDYEGGYEILYEVTFTFPWNLKIVNDMLKEVFSTQLSQININIFWHSLNDYAIGITYDYYYD